MAAKRKRGGTSGDGAKQPSHIRSAERIRELDYQPLQHGFVIMPFERTEEIDRAYDNGIKPALTALGFGCLRVDKIRHTSRIGNRIEDSIRRAYFVVADMTLDRPNCYYEVGFAHALGKPAILLARKGTTLHFDVRDYPCIFYESEQHLQAELEETVRDGVLASTDRDPEIDEWNGEFGRRAARNGRLLMAKVVRTYLEVEDDEASRVSDIRIDVLALPDGQGPLEGVVEFHVDKSYTRSAYRERVVEGYASIELEAVGGAFTIGAVADGGATKLELDLASVPGAHCTFYPPH
jgi:nucleoside 2-deoxyribosyltransferase